MIVTESDLETGGGKVTVVVCVNVRLGAKAQSCGGSDSEEIAEALEAGIEARGLAAEVARIHCLGLCSLGPNVRLVPNGNWYNQVALGDAEAILDDLSSALST